MSDEFFRDLEKARRGLEGRCEVIFLPLACPGEEPCGHTAREHLAFDDGLRAGEAGGEEDECPSYGGDFNLRHAWLSGFSVGQMNRGQ